MDQETILKWCESQDSAEIIEIPEYLIDELSKEQSEFIADYFNNTALIRLPEYEIEFFEWLKENDEDVWNDLWKTENETPYVVSISFLPMLIREERRGFPICDLLECSNYYFTEAHMTDEESKVYIETSRNRYINDKPLTIPQVLALEISTQPTDIWHFAYKHNLDIKTAKDAVKELVDDNALVHLTDAEHVAKFIDF
jgi:hypothetical protein